MFVPDAPFLDDLESVTAFALLGFDPWEAGLVVDAADEIGRLVLLGTDLIDPLAAVEASRADVVIIDARLDRAAAVRAARLLSGRFRVALLGDDQDIDLVSAAISAGCVDLLPPEPSRVQLATLFSGGVRRSRAG